MSVGSCPARYKSLASNAVLVCTLHDILQQPSSSARTYQPPVLICLSEKDLDESTADVAHLGELLREDVLAKEQDAGQE